jgi:hypothetical protein
MHLHWRPVLHPRCTLSATWTPLHSAFAVVPTREIGQGGGCKAYRMHNALILHTTALAQVG